jgi:hypothetical protein
MVARTYSLTRPLAPVENMQNPSSSGKKRGAVIGRLQIPVLALVPNRLGEGD